MTTLPPVCLLAGGLGSRLGVLTRDFPKALMDINGEPFLIHQLRELAVQGVSSVVLCVGYLGELIEEQIGTEAFGLRIDYSYDGPGLDGTLGAIRRAEHLLGEQFFVLYGDTILTVTYADAFERWSTSAAPAFMCVLENDGAWGDSNAKVEGGYVVDYDKFRRTPEMRWIDYGMSGLSRQLLGRCEQESDLAALWSLLASEGALAAYEVHDRFWEIGSPEALRETRDFLATRDRSPHRSNEGRQ